MMTDAHALLRAYALNGSEDSFRELVVRYLGLVYSTALRLVGDDAHRAEDVTQTVFADLARQAGTISTEVMLGGWLHQRTFNVATTVMRGERRRQVREKEAVEMKVFEAGSTDNLARIAPILDEAITQLNPEDRTAILLRFFERHDLRSIGQTLGTSEDAAQKRVSRALEKLRLLLQRRGVAISATALGTALITEELTAAPVALVGTIAGTALAGASLSGGTSVTLIKTLMMSKVKLGLLAAIVVGTAAVFVLQHNSNKQIRVEVAQLRAQLQQAEASSLAVDSASTSATGTGATQDESELLRLRGRISQMSQELLTLRSNQEAQARMLSMMERPFDLAQFPDSHIPINVPLATNAGTATPAAMLQTWLWATRNGDPEGLYITCDWPDGTSEAERQEDVNRRVQSAMELQGQPRDFEDYQLQALLPLGDGFYLATFFEWRDPIPRKFIGRRFFRKTEDGWRFALYRPKQAAFLGENPIRATEATR